MDHPVSYSAGTKVSVAAVLLCVAASAASAGLHGADLLRGPVPGLAERYALVACVSGRTGAVVLIGTPGDTGISTPTSLLDRPGPAVEDY